MKIAISQPAYLPWLGYFDLIDQVDQFVVLDNVQFEKQSWQQRNRIKTPSGLQWLTVPVEFRGRLGQQIREVRIREGDFARAHLRAIELAYRRAEFFEDHYGVLESHFATVEPGASLLELNLRILSWLLQVMRIDTPLVIASQLPVEGKRTELLAAICHHLGADTYVSPLGSAAYLLDEMKIMSDGGIEVFFQNYEHPVYRQLFPPFVPYACSLDLLLNEGPRSLEIVRGGRRELFTPGQVATQGAERSCTAR